MADDRLGDLERLSKLLDDRKFSQEEYDRLKADTLSGSPAPVPPTATTPPVLPKKKSRKGLWITIGSLILIIVLFLRERTKSRWG